MCVGWVGGCVCVCVCSPEDYITGQQHSPPAAICAHRAGLAATAEKSKTRTERGKKDFWAAGQHGRR